MYSPDSFYRSSSGDLVGAGFAVGRVRGDGVGFAPAGVGFAPAGVGDVFGIAPAAGVGEGCVLAFCGVVFGTGVGLTAALEFVTGTGQRYIPLGCRMQSGGMN